MTVDEVTALVIDALAGDLGPTMARASVLGIAARLGLHGQVGPVDVERLLEAVAPGLTVFLGRSEAQRVLDDVRQRLEGRGR